ncbi:AAA family ATPase [Streptomyces marincola]|uniref:AAA family ATPase n=1 Tax=Streptomyces marincola TaxID=2878388 RepID=UPI001CF1F6E2|nr:ATP-binding protein [Streptomyces marincola]UCM87545.1 ATP-binding protein [Streptomyces marincola]
MLLSFAVRNHRSIRDRAELTLTTTRLRTARPPEDDWKPYVTRVAAIYGANASGKSTLIHALEFMRAAVRNSATAWGHREDFPHYPFLLEDSFAGRASEYEADFVHGGVRYSYGFESDASGVRAEWLFSYPEGRRRKLFEREAREPESITFGRTLGGENSTMRKLVRPNALYLSVAANSNHPTLTPLWRHLVRNVEFVLLDEADKSARVERVKQWLTNEAALATAVSILSFADLGIEGVAIEEKELDQDFEKRFVSAMEALSGEPRPPEYWARVMEAQKKVLTFAHTSGAEGATKRLDIDRESSGTVSWLALAMPAVRAMRAGGVFVVDEIDASLHPRLTAALIQLFKDEQVNVAGAQLIFTSHDTTLLGGLVGDVLAHEETWFVEKNASGVSEVYSLAEFPVRADHNVERRYLGGRYGAVPVLSYERLRDALTHRAS